jgi:uncharacterized protein YbjT (DUF2867 family)
MVDSRRILILGATGRTGKLLLEQALEKGYKVNALVRNLEAFTVRHENLQLFEGTPADKQLLNEAMQDCQAILSTLNISRKSDFPWSALRTPQHFLSQTVSDIIDLCPAHKISRVIVLSAFGVGESRQYIPTWFRWLIDHSNIGAAYQEHESQERLLEASDLQYTAIRPTSLVNAFRPIDVIVSVRNLPKPGLTISRYNVARFMLDILELQAYLRQTPVVST